MSNRDITEYDEKGNIVYVKSSDGEFWFRHDERGNIINSRMADGPMLWREYDENDNEIHLVHSSGEESWYKWIANVEKMEITRREFEKIKKKKKKQKEFLSREPVSREELIDIE